MPESNHPHANVPFGFLFYIYEFKLKITSGRVVISHSWIFIFIIYKYHLLRDTHLSAKDAILATYFDCI